MEKIYCNKAASNLITLTIFFCINVFIGIIVIILYQSDYKVNLLITLALFIIINGITIPYIYRRLNKKYSSIINISKHSLGYIGKNDDFIVSIAAIKKLTYNRNQYSNLNELIIHLNNNEIKTIPASVFVSKRVSKLISKSLDFTGVSFPKKLVKTKNNVILFVKREKYKILFALIGLILSISFIIIYTNSSDNALLNSMIIILSVILCAIQLFLLYFKDKYFTKPLKLTLSLLSVFMLAMIFLVVILLLCIFMDIDFVFKDIVMYSVMILPSFIIVLVLIFLLVMALGYS